MNAGDKKAAQLVFAMLLFLLALVAGICITLAYS
jgi:hypothetical protein